MSEWLYPLSSKADYVFEYRGGRTSDTGPASFERMINGGAIDDRWGAHKSWKQAIAGERVWIYYGSADGDLGVCGAAAIKSVTPPSVARGRATLHLDFDVPITLRLLRNPYPAQSVRRHIPRPQGPVWRVPDALSGEISRHLGRPPVSRKPSRTPGYAPSEETTLSYTPPKVVTVHRRHDAMLRPLKTRLESLGWSEAELSTGTKRVDLAMAKGKTFVLVEAKTVSGSTSPEVRAAFAQLLEYSWRHQQGNPSSIVEPWALFEREPAPDEVAFLEHYKILVSWVDAKRRRTLHSAKTLQRLAQLDAV